MYKILIIRIWHWAIRTDGGPGDGGTWRRGDAVRLRSPTGETGRRGDGETGRLGDGETGVSPLSPNPFLPKREKGE